MSASCVFTSFMYVTMCLCSVYVCVCACMCSDCGYLVRNWNHSLCLLYFTGVLASVKKMKQGMSFEIGQLKQQLQNLKEKPLGKVCVHCCVLCIHTSSS